MKKFVRQLQPGQQFILLRTGVQYKFLRRECCTPSGTKHIAIKDDPYIVGDIKESSLHHACHVWLKDSVGCAECGVNGGYALYCVACAAKFVGGYKDSGVPAVETGLEQVSPDTPPQRTWVGLTDEEIEIIELAIQGHASTRDAIRWAMIQEREACANICEDSVEYAGDTLAEAIRNRGRA